MRARRVVTAVRLVMALMLLAIPITEITKHQIGLVWADAIKMVPMTTPITGEVVVRLSSILPASWCSMVISLPTAVRFTDMTMALDRGALSGWM